MPVTLDEGEREPRGARDRRARQSGGAWFCVVLIRVDYGPVASAGAGAGAAPEQAEAGRCLAAGSTRRSFNTPPQCEQSMGVGAAGASMSVLTGRAANPCAISTRALTSSKATPKEGERKP